MPEGEGKVTRVYTLVQNLITAYINQEQPFTLDLLQEAFFGSAYNRDSKEQHEIIYGCIMLGREKAADLWSVYIKEDNGCTFNSEVESLQRSVEGAISYDAEKATQDFKDFYSDLHNNRFGKSTREIIENLNEELAIAIIFKRKMKEFSLKGHTFLIALYGKKARWFIPSWWKWNEREFYLYRRTIRTLQKQLDRGEQTMVMLPSGKTIAEAKRLTSVSQAAIEDTTTWECTNCHISNIADYASCVVCGEERILNKEASST